MLVLGILKFLGMKEKQYQTIKEMPLGFAVSISTLAYKIVETFTINYYFFN